MTLILSTKRKRKQVSYAEAADDAEFEEAIAISDVEDEIDEESASRAVPRISPSSLPFDQANHRASRNKAKARSE